MLESVHALLSSSYQCGSNKRGSAGQRQTEVSDATVLFIIIVHTFRTGWFS